MGPTAATSMSCARRPFCHACTPLTRLHVLRAVLNDGFLAFLLDDGSLCCGGGQTPEGAAPDEQGVYAID